MNIDGVFYERDADCMDAVWTRVHSSLMGHLLHGYNETYINVNKVAADRHLPEAEK